jgi:hypothetical protein
MKKIPGLLVLFMLCLSAKSLAQSYEIIHSDYQRFKIKVNFNGYYEVKDTLIEGQVFHFIKGDNPGLRMPGEPWLPNYNFNLGISFGASPKIVSVSSKKTNFPNRRIIPFPDIDIVEAERGGLYFDRDTYSRNQLFPLSIAQIQDPAVFRFARYAPVVLNPFQYNPVTRELIFHEEIIVEINYNIDPINQSFRTKVNDKLSETLISSTVLNPDIATSWISKKTDQTSKVNSDYTWYDPSKTYYKVYLNRRDVYRITYSYLQDRGILDGAPVTNDNIRLYLEGEEVPLDLFTSDPTTFGQGDYFQFVGKEISPSEFAKVNIYNLTNIYWLTFDGGADPPVRYIEKSGYPNTWARTVKEAYETVRYERDTLYERLGYALDGNRDYWYWAKVNGSNGNPGARFEGRFDAFKNPSEENLLRKVRVNLHGITNLTCQQDHKANIAITNQFLGSIEWDGQTEITYEREFIQSIDSIRIFPSGNLLQVWTDGNVCNSSLSDEFRVNWFEFDYYRYMRADSNHYFFRSPPNLFGVNRYDVWQWQRQNMKIYVPEGGFMLTSPLITNDAYNSVFFVDTLNERRWYHCVAKDYYATIDSIEINDNSDLRNSNNEADYIILTHPDFMEAAQRLKNYREANLSGFPNPRVKIVRVDHLYNEFSHGFLTPFAIRDFVEYAFNNWANGAPTYLVLLGDMSYDYRGLLSDSRPNFIPSMPHHSFRYGLAAADNNFVTVAGDDFVPELAIGRLSCETMEEANVLIDKIINYPADSDKYWKQDVLLIGAGQDEQDELNFGFNDDNVELENVFLNPNGYSGSRVFRYINKPEYQPFQGGGPEIRAEFDEGTILANFYGHGGGYQWDLVFLDDDILALNNGGRLPVVLSVTCYTAHFDNQEVFGETFNSVPGKGSIGFWGNTGLTYYQYGVSLNKYFFQKLFNEEHYVLGDAFMSAKLAYSGIINNRPKNDHLALLTFLGDPALRIALPDKPDFVINSTDISVTPQNSLVGDSVKIKAVIHNIGRVFPDDSVNVEFFISFADTAFTALNKKLPSFTHEDSVVFYFSPDRDGLVNLQVRVNQIDVIDEIDMSDNTAQSSSQSLT